MIEILKYSFMQNALLSCFFTVIICAVAGTLAVVNRNVFITGGVAHASYGGIGFALWAGFSPLFGALGVAALAGLLLGLIRQKYADKADTLVSVLWAAGMATGILLTDLTPGYSADYLSYLFGSILLVSLREIVILGIFAAALLLLAVRYYRILLIVSADQEYAVTLGIPVKRLNLALLVLLCISVVLLMRVAGLVMVMALLSIPAAIAETRTKQLSRMMLLSGLTASAAVFGGLLLATYLDLTPGAVIVAFLAVMYLVNTIANR
ncbi:MAG: metal ABC transporter permease [Deferribacteraceae bacterium]|jgi:zinc transport system permease protein|nr:metal ABC transporter permease [Deferribacteraceae bacterium]